uniref:Uncharacterized protein n=1 Tax=Tanacetum cinerariifolium TaxID=118510 RepID=A0A6L2KT90_TANCI|nr:hypothetical protein [Tanacetum cinerariifolium]
MVKSSSSSKNEVFDDSLCSTSCRKNSDSLNTKITNLNEALSDRLSEFADDTITDYSRSSPSIESNTSDLPNNNSSVFENEESLSCIMSKSMIKFVKATDSPIVIKTNKVETARKPPVKYAEMYMNTSKSPKVKASISAARRVNTAASRPNVNSTRPKTTQDLLIIKLIQRVKRLERELKARTPPIKIHYVDVKGRSRDSKSKEVVDYILQVKKKLLIKKLEDSEAEHQV